MLITSLIVLTVLLHTFLMSIISIRTALALRELIVPPTKSLVNLHFYKSRILPTGKILRIIEPSLMK